MARRISMATRVELVSAIRDRYRSCGGSEKTPVLDEFVAVTGYHRKHAIRLLRKDEEPPRLGKRTATRYGDDVRDALVAVWEVSDRLCSRRLRAMIPVLLPALERHGRLSLDADLREKLLTVSTATMDRLLSPVRIVACGGQRRRAGLSSAVRRSVPVRTFGDWHDPPPGYVEVDFVAHSGPSSTGSFVQTLVLTDIATGWTECIAVLMRESSLVIAALDRARQLFPFDLLGVDFDNDSAFMNDLVVPWCRNQGLVVTRARAYRKNDQAWVEQKNGAIVRRLVGYGRLVGAESAAALAGLYESARLHGNLFQPSFKLREKTRTGARVIKRYHPPLPPAARVLAHPDVTPTDKGKIEAMLASADPVLLFAEIRAAQEELGRRVDRRGLGVQPAESDAIDLAGGRNPSDAPSPLPASEAHSATAEYVRSSRSADPGVA
ncbi:transposase family protein [Nguyenibacter vanlangensis]|uniref:Transposase family protein n=1 Tax=Nguyenibacter vanlangensis TaxID=1216886 RepID=A0ABZ3D3J6_9PROT